ncbi:MAG: gamma-glutamylcyclotransferase [Acidobacteria bacterium]|nr:gamma-glutamylcyclotransferase [Acidobacteriota bacterium]
MPELVFFYGTLMTGFDRRRRAGIDEHIEYFGRGTIAADLFDLGIYPAAVPAPDGRVWGEVYAVKDRDKALGGLDDIEGYRPDDPDRSLYIRTQVDVALTDGRHERAWVYFYNAPLGRAERIPSGDYLAHIKVR